MIVSVASMFTLNRSKRTMFYLQYAYKNFLSLFSPHRIFMEEAMWRPRPDSHPDMNSPSTQGGIYPSCTRELEQSFRPLSFFFPIHIFLPTHILYYPVQDNVTIWKNKFKKIIVSLLLKKVEYGRAWSNIIYVIKQLPVFNQKMVSWLFQRDRK